MTTTAVEQPACPYCQCGGHLTPEACPRVAAVEYFETGAVKEVRFHPPQPMTYGVTTPFLVGSGKS